MAYWNIWLPLVILAAYLVWKRMRARRVRSLVDAPSTVIIDVRTRAEFAAGANKKSLNIPLDELPAKIAQLDRRRPIVVCCASGGRSAVAAAMLRNSGFAQVTNAGAWTNTCAC